MRKPSKIIALAKPNGDVTFGERAPSVLVRIIAPDRQSMEILFSRDEARTLEAQLHHANAAFELAETISEEHRKESERG